MNGTTIIFVRHGEVYNPKRLLYARLPKFPISKNGVKQIEQAFEKLKKYSIDFLYSSPLLRTRQSASIFADKLNLVLNISRLLIEVNQIHQGIDLDLYKKEIQPHLYEEKYVSLGQESVVEIANRMLKFVKRIKKRHAGKTVLALSHGDPIVILKSAIEGSNFTWKYKKNNYLQTADFLILNPQNNKFY